MSPAQSQVRSAPDFAKCILENNLITSEAKKITPGRRDRLSACISRDKVPFERSSVASDHYPEIFEFPVWKPLKKSFDALSNFFLAGIGLPKPIRPD